MGPKHDKTVLHPVGCPENTPFWNWIYTPYPSTSPGTMLYPVSTSTMGKKKLVADGYGRYPVLLWPKGLGGWATRFHNMLNSHKVDDKGRNEICLKFEATSEQLTNYGGFSNRDITSSVFLNVGGSCLLEILSVFWSTASSTNFSGFPGER